MDQQKAWHKARSRTVVSVDLGKMGQCLYDYKAQDANQLSFQKGDMITNIEEASDGWMIGQLLGSSERKYFPSSHVDIQDPNKSKSSSLGAIPPVPFYVQTVDDYQPSNPDLAKFKKGDMLKIVKAKDNGWWLAEIEINGKKAAKWAPVPFLKILGPEPEKTTQTTRPKSLARSLSSLPEKPTSPSTKQSLFAKLTAFLQNRPPQVRISNHSNYP
jgi:hypothetical protein